MNSPPGALAAGGVLAGVVWKSFERVESVLTDETKFEIAVWLVGVGVSQKVERWPDTFGKVFDQAFGEKHLSWKCVKRSVIASSIGILIFGTWFVYLMFLIDLPMRAIDYLVVLLGLLLCLVFDCRSGASLSVKSRDLATSAVHRNL